MATREQWVEDARLSEQDGDIERANQIYSHLGLPPVNTDPQLQVDSGWQEAKNIAGDVFSEHLPAAALNAFQVPTFGYSDEIMSGLGMSGAEDFRAEHREQYPAAGILSEGAAALATGVLTGPAVLARTAGFVSPVARGAANTGVAALSGALYGSGTADPGERLMGAATDAGIAAVGGPALYAAGRAGSALLEPIKEYGGRVFRSATDQAATVLGREKNKAGIPVDADSNTRLRAEITPESVTADNDMGALVMNADTDPVSAQQLKNLYDNNPEYRGQIEGELIPRQKNSSRRALDDISEITGLPRDTRNMAADIEEKANRAMISEGYDKVYESNVPVDNAIGEMFMGPEGNDLRRAYRQAEKIAAREGDAIPTYDSVFGDDGSLSELPLKSIDYMQRFFRNAGKPNIASPTHDHLSWRKLRDRFLGEVDDMVPEFKDIRRTYATQSGVKNAFEEGSGIYKMGDARDIGDYMDTLSDGELEGFRRGAIDAVESRMRNARIKSGNLDTHMQGTANQEDIIDLVFSDKSDQVRKVLSREDAFNRTYGQVLGGSTTSKNLGGGDFLDGVLSNNGGGLVDRGWSIAKDLAGSAVGADQHETTLKAMVDQLMAKGYTAKQAERMARAGNAASLITNSGRGAAGAGALSAPVIYSSLENK